eukprot:5362223-Amphidinium_carterae.1
MGIYSVSKWSLQTSHRAALKAERRLLSQLETSMQCATHSVLAIPSLSSMAGWCVVEDLRPLQSQVCPRKRRRRRRRPTKVGRCARCEAERSQSLCAL